MRKLFFLVLLFCWIVTGFTNAHSVLAVEQVESIKEALSRIFCYEMYWEGEDYKLDIPLAIETKIEDKKFYVWINDLKVTERSHIAGFYTGRIKDGKGAVILRYGHNLNITPLSYLYESHRDYFKSGTIIKDSLTLPTDCTPKFNPMTPQKELMIKTILSTIKKQFEHHIKIGIAKYPKKLTLIIADFNIDYPETYVIVKETNDIYGMVLHKFSDYDSDEYEREGEYPSAPEFHLSENKIEKIRKHGIIRKIVLEP